MSNASTTRPNWLTSRQERWEVGRERFVVQDWESRDQARLVIGSHCSMRYGHLGV